MIGAILLIVLLFFISQPILSLLKLKHPFMNLRMMRGLYWYHYFFALIYYLYALSSPSDSHAYFERPQYKYQYWGETFELGTRFIDFLGYPFINYLGFSYEMMMALFAWLGYIGFIFFYIFFKENIRFKHRFRGVDLITIFMFLPNMHFWTASLGKGSIIFMGIAFAAYGMSRLGSRKLMLAIGLLIVYFIRPHVFLFMGFGILVGLFTGKADVPLYQKIFVVAASIVAIVLLYDKIMTYVSLDTDNLLESFDEFTSKRASSLARATSGVAIDSYSIPLKLLTFWYRPLFIDGPGFLGQVVSVENLFYVVLTFKFFQKGIFKFLSNSRALIKASLVIFLVTSFALSTTMSNLGIIIREKSMVMYFLFFALLAFLDYKKEQQLVRKKLIQLRRNRLMQPEGAAGS